jgi:hypothetical protein
MSRGMIDTYGERTIVSWLQEFGYLFYANAEAAIHQAMTERGPRWKRELRQHADRLKVKP